MPKLTPVSELKACPECGSTEGFIEQSTVTGFTQFRYSFDGEHVDNGDMYQSIVEEKPKTVLCMNCKKPIGSWNYAQREIVTERNQKQMGAKY
jgi:hypothetical protein